MGALLAAGDGAAGASASVQAGHQGGGHEEVMRVHEGQQGRGQEGIAGVGETDVQCKGEALRLTCNARGQVASDVALEVDSRPDVVALLVARECEG